ncbi:hypothetical protein EDEG_02300 [Edhazardia aedis USNM 41457]|uniref:Major facilitator superfamily (MFS) profile domain-containing protein n=1 Tax=Edhazardia aedis (strain USNM 41457) TaxID=1003232 RepID=J9DL88_EDHAE|nr:hypothetical protein EDEG_02300 [Edhazardia aedis USNM 41457]|eukprot:EJW03360.1 hypothetical protein EDEG_02300 [Edhazardia aedis USNM 41457]
MGKNKVDKSENKKDYNEDCNIKESSFKRRFSSAVIASILAFIFGISLTNTCGLYTVSSDLFNKILNGEVYTAPSTFIKQKIPLKSVEIGLASALVAIGALFSSLGIAYINTSLVTKFYISSILYLLGNLIISAIGNVYMLYAGKFVIGLAAGVTCSIVPLYISLIAPENSEMLFNSMMPIGIVSGLLCGQISSYFYEKAENWRTSFYITFLVLTINLVSLLFAQNINLKTNQEERIGMLQLLRLKKARKSVIVSIIVHLAQQFSGINAVLIFSYSIFSKQKDPGLYSILSLTVSLISTFLTIFTSKKFGRKRLLTASCLLCGIGLLGLIFDLFPLASMFIYMFGFNVGLSPIPWVITAELFPPEYVVAGIQISTCVNWLSNAAVTIFFPVLQKILKSYAFSFFIVFMAFSAVFFTFFLKETKGRGAKLQ